MLRTGLALLALATLATAQETAKEAHRMARALHGEKRLAFAAEQAARFDGKAAGDDHVYVGYLWVYAEEWSKAADAFTLFLAAAPDSVNRPNAMLQAAICLCGARRYGEVEAVVKAFRSEFPSHRYLGRIRFCEARALRMRGDLPAALTAFRASVLAGHENGRYEVVDCLVQAGRYEEAAEAARELDTGSTRFETFRRAHPRLGRPLPKKLAFDYWTGTELASAELREKPALLSFWSTMGGSSRHLIHEVTNGWARAFGEKVHVIGPTVYARFDPVRMRTVEEMSPLEERGFVASWHEEYGVQYPLVLMGDQVLHEACGVDPSTPALPAFALSDRKGVLRYVRVASSDFELEAVEAMLTRLASE